MRKLKTLLATAVGSLALSGCEAGAIDKEADTTKFKKLEAVVEPITLTQAECRALKGTTKEEKLTCMRKAKAARQAEIAALNEKIEEGRANNEVLMKEIAGKVTEGPTR